MESPWAARAAAPELERRRVEVIEAHDHLAAERIPAEQRDVLVGLQHGEEVGHRQLDQVDLALLQRVGRGQRKWERVESEI